VIKEARDEFGHSDVARLSALIRFWSHDEPSDDTEMFAEQAAGALWIEDRTITSFGKVIGKAVGGGS